MKHKRKQNKPSRLPSSRVVKVAVISTVLLLVAVVLVAKNRASAARTQAQPLSRVTATAPLAAAQGQAATQAPTSAPAGELPEAQYRRLLSAGQPFLAFFHSTTCAKCKQMMATVAQVCPEFSGSVGLVDVDVYDKANTRLLGTAGIHVIPTQIFYDSSGQPKVVLGVMTPDELRQQMQALAGAQ